MTSGHVSYCQRAVGYRRGRLVLCGPRSERPDPKWKLRDSNSQAKILARKPVLPKLTQLQNPSFMGHSEHSVELTQTPRASVADWPSGIHQVLNRRAGKPDLRGP